MTTRKLYTTTVQKGPDGTVLFVANSGQPDRDNDRIPANAWSLDNYLRNPIVLLNHVSFGISALPIGKATVVQATGDGLLARVQFTPPEINPLGDQVRRLVESGFMRGMSVGFQPHQMPVPDNTGVMVFPPNSCELLELSVCTVPADARALAQVGKALGLTTRGDEEEFILDIIDTGDTIEVDDGVIRYARQLEAARGQQIDIDEAGLAKLIGDALRSALGARITSITGQLN